MSLLWKTALGQIDLPESTEDRPYYHGSSHEFEPGDIVYPQKMTGAPNWAEQLGHTGPLGKHYTGDHVHHTDTIYQARDFGKHVYVVEPLTPVEKDPESKVPGYPDQGWTRNKGPARVIRKVVR